MASSLALQPPPTTTNTTSTSNTPISTKSLLPSSSRSSGKKDGLLDIKIQYRTAIPPPPCGPYFRPVNILSSLDQGLPEYRTSTLEKSFIWQPHLGPDMSIKLDLVDLESIVLPEVNQEVNPIELTYLPGGSFDKKNGQNNNNNSNSHRNLKKLYDQDSKPWWLRNTTYLSNTPFNISNKVKNDDLVQKGREEKLKKLNNEIQDIFAYDVADQSFKQMEITIQRLMAEKQSKDKNVALSWSASFLPQHEKADDNDNNDEVVLIHRKRSLIRFDEDPKSLPRSSHGNKRLKVEEGILTNERDCRKDDGTLIKNAMDVSFVAPSTTKTDLHEEEKYSWVKDYRMEVHDANNDSFLFVVDEETGEACFLPVLTRMEMRKLGPDTSKPVDCFVHRKEKEA
eukprot:gene3845-4201_t